MTETYLRFAILGLASGALYALVALGVVIVRRASGVLNFAASSIGAFGAYATYSLRDDHGVPTPLAVVVGVLVGMAFGVVTQLLVMRLPRQSSSLTRLIATLGMMTAIQGLIAVVFGHDDQTVPTPFLPSGRVKIASGIVLTEDRLISLGIAVVLALVLGILYARTRFGMSATAVAENPTIASSFGISASRVEVINFALAGGLSAFAAILIVPIVGLSVTALVLIIIPALAAALFGNFTSFSLTVVGAMLIGALQAIVPVIPVVSRHVDYLSGLPQAVPLLVIVVVTSVRGSLRPARGELLGRLPLPGTGRIRPVLVAVAAAAGLIAVVVSDNEMAGALAATFAYAILVLSVVVVSGYAGQLSLAQFALAGFGAWVAARLYATHGLPFPAALLLGVVFTVPLAVLVALPALRTRGFGLAVATLGLALMIEAMILDSSALTGGYSGTSVPNPTVFGWHIDGSVHPHRYALVCLVMLVLASLLVANVRRGRTGRRLLAVRGNERAAAAIGIGVYTAKLYAFGLAGALAALSGVLLGFRSVNVEFQQFDALGSISAVVYATVGGIGWVGSVVIGAVLAPGTALQQGLSQLVDTQNYANYILLIAGALVVVVIGVAPDGLGAFYARAAARLPLGWSIPGRTMARPIPARGRRGGTVDVVDLHVRFGGIVALDGVTLHVRPGQVLGVLGPNGAGKTTLLDTITGFTSAQTGTIRLDDEDITRWSPERRARHGLARSFQAVELFDELSVRENLLTAADDHLYRAYFRDLINPGRRRSFEVIDQVVDEFGLSDLLDMRPTELSQGQARLVGIARAVCTEPRVLFLDEPAAGLDQQERHELAHLVRVLADKRGLAVILVEHDVALVSAACDEVAVLDFGRLIAVGHPQQVMSDPAVISAYVGRIGESVDESGIATDSLVDVSGQNLG